MKRPSVITYLFGNPLSLTLLMFAAFGVIYEWWIGEAPGLIAVVAVFLAIHAMNSYEKVQSYSDWKRDWDALDGSASGWHFALLIDSWPRIRPWIAGSLYFAWAYYIVMHPDDPDIGIHLLSFVPITLLLVGRFIYLLVRRILRRRKARDVAVALCVKNPRRSPSLSQAMKELPTYCKSLIACEASH